MCLLFETLPPRLLVIVLIAIPRWKSQLVQIDTTPSDDPQQGGIGWDPGILIETCATIIWERVERETSWKTCVYYVENSNMGTSLILLVVVEMGVIKYKNLNKYESKPWH